MSTDKYSAKICKGPPPPIFQYFTWNGSSGYTCAVCKNSLQGRLTHDLEYHLRTHHKEVDVKSLTGIRVEEGENAVTYKRGYPLMNYNLVTRNLNADVRIICEDGFVLTHTCVLQQVSTFISELFTDQGEKYTETRTIFLPDFDTKSVEKAIQLVCSGAADADSRAEACCIVDILDILGINRTNVCLYKHEDPISDLNSEKDESSQNVIVKEEFCDFDTGDSSEKICIITDVRGSRNVPGSAQEQESPNVTRKRKPVVPFLVNSFNRAIEKQTAAVASASQRVLRSRENTKKLKLDIFDDGKLSYSKLGSRGRMLPSAGNTEHLIKSLDQERSYKILDSEDRDCDSNQKLTNSKLESSCNPSPYSTNNRKVTNRVQKSDINPHRMFLNDSEFQNTSARLSALPHTAVSKVDMFNSKKVGSMQQQTGLEFKNKTTIVSKPPMSKNGNLLNRLSVLTFPPATITVTSAAGSTLNSSSTNIANSAKKSNSGISITPMSNSIPNTRNVMSLVSEGASFPNPAGKSNKNHLNPPNSASKSSQLEPETILSSTHTTDETKYVGCYYEQRYENRDLYMEDAKKCVKCNKTFSHIKQAADCIKTHGLVRCFFCFDVFANTDVLFQHYANVHHSKCPLCLKTIPFHQATSHAISDHVFDKNKRMRGTLNNGNIPPSPEMVKTIKEQQLQQEQNIKNLSTIGTLVSLERTNQTPEMENIQLSAPNENNVDDNNLLHLEQEPTVLIKEEFPQN